MSKPMVPQEQLVRCCICRRLRPQSRITCTTRSGGLVCDLCDPDVFDGDGDEDADGVPA